MKKQIKRWITMVLTLPFCYMMVAGCAKEEAAKKVILVVSFGTSYNDNRDLSIGAIERAIQKAYPDYEVRRAFTSQIIVDILAERDNLKIDNVTEAMERLMADGIKEVVIQPTHVINGFEYEDIVAELTPYADKFDSLKIGKALLTFDEDYAEVASVITEETKKYNVDGTAIAFMGHGTHHEANSAYIKLQQVLIAAGHDNYFIGTVEAEPDLEAVMFLVKNSAVKKVVLLPLMIVAGDHATNDMAGEEGSWKTAFEAEGLEVECVLTGLGQFAGIREMMVKHTAQTIAE